MQSLNRNANLAVLAGLSVKDYRAICQTNSEWMCTKCFWMFFQLVLTILSHLKQAPPASQTLLRKKNNHGLSCVLANVRSIRNKLQDFHTLVYAAGTNIIALTETWLDCSVLDHEILPHGYSIFRRDRLGRSGGGVLPACRDDIVCITRSDLELNGCDCKKLIRSKYNGYLHDLSRVVSDNPKSFETSSVIKPNPERYHMPLLRMGLAVTS